MNTMVLEYGELLLEKISTTVGYVLKFSFEI